MRAFAVSDQSALLLETYSTTFLIPGSTPAMKTPSGKNSLGSNVFILRSHGLWWADIVYVALTPPPKDRCAIVGEGSTRSSNAFCQRSGEGFFTRCSFAALTSASELSR